MEKNNSPPILIPIGERIKAMRKARKIKQKHMAHILATSYITIANHELGRVRVSKNWIWCYAIVFGCQPEEITEGTDWEGDSSFYKH